MSTTTTTDCTLLDISNNHVLSIKEEKEENDEKISQDELLYFISLASKIVEAENPWMLHPIPAECTTESQNSSVSDDTETESDDNKETIKGPKVLMWEFFRDLLQDKKTNPKFVKWIDEPNLVFRIERSEEVAKMWSIRKGYKHGKLMNYDTMSRGMRDGIKRGFFKKPEIKKYKCHHIRQFGKRSSEQCLWLQSIIKK